MPSRKILIADDDRDLVKLLAFCLTQAGFEVVTASDGHTAAQCAREHQPDLCILDVNMPAGSGLLVQESAPKGWAVNSAPVIYLTGDKRADVLADAKRLGARNVLYKPFETADLLEAVRSAIDA